MKALVYAALVATAIAQRPARIGKDGKPLLNRPVLDECMKRKSHMKIGGHNYFLSWREPWHKFEDWDWFNGRNFCRDRCMDLVSFETAEEYNMFSEIMKKDNVSSVWTSGRKCNFQNKGCDGAHLQPILTNGWFWAGAKNARIAATDRPSPNSFWSSSGETGEPQPDNWEGVKEGPIDVENNIGITIEGLQEFHDEACLTVLNNKYEDGIKWHDVACHFRSVIICEDSDQLIDLVNSEEGVDVRDETEEGTNSIDIDSLPQLPIVAPAPPPVQPVPQVVNPPPTQFQTFQQPNPSLPVAPGSPLPRPQGSLPLPPRRPVQTNFNSADQFQNAIPPARFQRPRPQRPTGVLGGLFSGFKLPFFS